MPIWRKLLHWFLSLQAATGNPFFLDDHLLGVLLFLEALNLAKVRILSFIAEQERAAVLSICDWNDGERERNDYLYYSFYQQIITL